MGEWTRAAKKTLQPSELPQCEALKSFDPDAPDGQQFQQPARGCDNRIAYRIHERGGTGSVYAVCAECLPKQLGWLNKLAVRAGEKLPTVVRVTYLRDRNAAAYGRTEYVESVERVPNTVQHALF